jgi:hypothetical protein
MQFEQRILRFRDPLILKKTLFYAVLQNLVLAMW